MDQRKQATVPVILSKLHMTMIIILQLAYTYVLHTDRLWNTLKDIMALKWNNWQPRELA